MARISFPASVAFAACLAFAALPVAAEIAPWGAKGKVARVFEHDLGPDQKKAYRQFRSACCYFAAYSINTGTDVGFFTQGFNSLASAIDAAEFGCKEVSREEKSDPAQCRLYAYAIPAELEPGDAKAKGLGIPARDGFVKDYSKSQTTTGYGAFAIGPARGWGASWNWASAAEAKDAALAHCAADVATLMADLSPDGRAYARANRLDQCKVVHESKPAS